MFVFEQRSASPCCWTLGGSRTSERLSDPAPQTRPASSGCGAAGWCPGSRCPAHHSAPRWRRSCSPELWPSPCGTAPTQSDPQESRCCDMVTATIQSEAGSGGHEQMLGTEGRSSIRTRAAAAGSETCPQSRQASGSAWTTLQGRVTAPLAAEQSPRLRPR